MLGISKRLKASEGRPISINGNFGNG